MTRNPNTSVNDLHMKTDRKEALTAGSLVAAAFMLFVSFIARRFYQ